MSLRISAGSRSVTSTSSNASGGADAAGAGGLPLGEGGEPMLRALGYDIQAIRPKEYQLPRLETLDDRNSLNFEE